MYKLNIWASKIEGYNNSYARLQWLMREENSKYVDAAFVEAAKKALQQEYKNTVAYLDEQKKKLTGKSK